MKNLKEDRVISTVEEIFERCGISSIDKYKNSLDKSLTLGKCILDSIEKGMIYDHNKVQVDNYETATFKVDIFENRFPKEKGGEVDLSWMK